MLREKFKNHQIILASQSPRRQELLKGLDIDFEIKVRPIEEHFNPELTRELITDHLAKQKASAFTEIKENQIIITSDTIVWHNNKALGKPTSPDEAASMLRSLSNSVHEVFTSVCFTTVHQQIVINDCTKVFFKPITEEEVDYYVTHYTPMDRAGSYGIQDWLGFSKVEKIEGCYYNVMGLPLPKVYEVMEELDI